MTLGSALHQQGQSKIYIKQQPTPTAGITTEQVVDSGGVINILGEQALNSVYIPSKATFVIAAGSANVTTVTISIVSNTGQAVAQVMDLDINLSDAATGAGLTATTASGAVAAGTPGAVIGTFTAKKSLRVQTDATGTFQLSITDTGKTGFFIHVAGPFPLPAISRQLVTGDYG